MKKKADADEAKTLLEIDDEERMPTFVAESRVSVFSLPQSHPDKDKDKNKKNNNTTATNMNLV